MTCPRCYAEFEARPGACPECGVRLLRNVSGMIKTSAIMIAAEGEHGFYRSVKDVPEPLRRQLLRVTGGENSGTIVIADRAGKEQLTQIVALREAWRGGSFQASFPSSFQSSFQSSTAEPRTEPAHAFWGLSWVVWTGILLASGSAGLVAAVFGFHW